MSVLHVPTTHSLAAASGQERRKAPCLLIVRRAAIRALRVVGRTFAAPHVLWWLGLPWQSHRPPRKGTDGGDR